MLRKTVRYNDKQNDLIAYSVTNRKKRIQNTFINKYSTYHR